MLSFDTKRTRRCVQPFQQVQMAVRVISTLAEDYAGTSDPTPLDRLNTYVHQPGGAYIHFMHLMSHLQIPRPTLACMLMGKCDTLDDDDLTANLTQPVRLSFTLTRLQ